MGHGCSPCVALQLDGRLSLQLGQPGMTSVCDMFSITDEAVGTVQSVISVSGSQSLCRYLLGSWMWAGIRSIMAKNNHN